MFCTFQGFCWGILNVIIVNARTLFSCSQRSCGYLFVILTYLYVCMISSNSFCVRSSQSQTCCEKIASSTLFACSLWQEAVWQNWILQMLADCVKLAPCPSLICTRLGAGIHRQTFTLSLRWRRYAFEVAVHIWCQRFAAPPQPAVWTHRCGGVLPGSIFQIN